MAISSDGSNANYLIRTASLPAKNPISLRVWAYLSVDRDSYQGAVALNKSGDELFYCGTDIDGTTLAQYAGADFDVSGTSLGLLEWTHLVWTYDGVTGRIYKNGTPVFSAAMSQSADPAISLTFLNTDFGSWFQGAVGPSALWERELTAQQVADDIHNPQPIFTTDLWDWWNFGSPTDIRGRANGRDMSLVGTPIAFPGPSFTRPTSGITAA